MARPSRLPEPATTLVLNALRQGKKPLSAYALLEKLHQTGIHSSPIVYRALNALQKKGLAHKINRLNAYVACNCNHSHRHELSILTVCQQCDHVEELHQKPVIAHINALREMGVLLSPEAVVELPVICTQCVPIVPAA